MGDYTSAIEYFQRSLTEHRTPEILTKLREVIPHSAKNPLLTIRLKRQKRSKIDLRTLIKEKPMKRANKETRNLKTAIIPLLSNPTPKQLNVPQKMHEATLIVLPLTSNSHPSQKQ